MGLFDYFVMGLYLFLVLLVGWRSRRKNSSYTEFFQAGKSMGWFPVGLSVMVTVFSVINYMAMPTEVLGNGLYVVISLPVFFLAAALISRVWLPFFYDLNLKTVYEYFELRFNRKVRILAGLVFIFWRFFWIATALYAAGNLLSKVTALRIEYVIITGGMVATIYTFMGGIRAVMWTDCLQFAVLFGGIALGVVMVVSNTGVSDLYAVIVEGGRLRPFYPFDSSFFSFDPGIRISFWSGLIGVTVAFLSRYGADQVVMQRYFSARSLQAAQRGIWFNSFAAVFSLSLLVVFGLIIYVHSVNTGHFEGIDFDALSTIKRKQLAMKEFIGVIRSFPPGVIGMVVSGLLAATMSSVDSGINACLNSFVTDIKRFPAGKSRDDFSRNINRSGVLFIGLICTFLALLYMPAVGAKQSLFMIVNKVINALGSPLLALFVGAMFCKKVNSFGAFYGVLSGFVFSAISSFIISHLALHYYGVINFIVTIGLIYLLSVVAEIFGYKEKSTGNEVYLFFK